MSANMDSVYGGVEGVKPHNQGGGKPQNLPDDRSPPNRSWGGLAPEVEHGVGASCLGEGPNPRTCQTKDSRKKNEGCAHPLFFAKKKKEGCAHPLLFFCRKKRGVRAPFFFVQKKEGCAHFFSSFLMKNILKKTRGARTPFFFLSSFLMKNIGKKTRGARPPFFPLVFDEKQNKK